MKEDIEMKEEIIVENIENIENVENLIQIIKEDRGVVFKQIEDKDLYAITINNDEYMRTEPLFLLGNLIEVSTFLKKNFSFTYLYYIGLRDLEEFVSRDVYDFIMRISESLIENKKIEVRSFDIIFKEEAKYVELTFLINDKSKKIILEKTQEKQKENVMEEIISLMDYYHYFEEEEEKRKNFLTELKGIIKDFSIIKFNEYAHNNLPEYLKITYEFDAKNSALVYIYLLNNKTNKTIKISEEKFNSQTEKEKIGRVLTEFFQEQKLLDKNTTIIF